MEDRRLHLAELLDFRPDEGVIRPHEQRVVILSAAAMGLLRKELIDTLGAETARRFLMRFGFADGYHDAVSLRDRAAWSNPLDGLRTGAVVHTLEGIVRSELTSVDFDPATGRFEAEVDGTIRMKPNSTCITTGRAPSRYAGRSSALRRVSPLHLHRAA